MNNNKIYLQITSGRGPAECCRVVALVLEIILKEAKEKNIKAEVIDRENGPINRTLLSATLSLEGDMTKNIINDWQGTIQWISKSPYRVFHKRKNWFIGVETFDVSDNLKANEKDIVYETLRASGPGGQHVNKTESAVRAIHKPTGISVMASDQRSQLQNKKLAIERLLIKLSAWDLEQAMIAAQANWSKHNNLERGNPIKIIELPLRG